MGRTQIYLGDEELELLDKAGNLTGASRSELIRRAIRTAFGEASPDQRIQALLETAGAWPDRQFTGAEYVDGVRWDLNRRLKVLGMD